MIDLSKRKVATLQLCSPLRSLPIHYAGRSYVCSGDGCPMCLFERPRTRWYGAARTSGSPSLIEIGSSLADLIFTELRKDTNLQIVGLCMALTRSDKRRPWAITQLRQIECREINEQTIIWLAADLFRVPSSYGIETWSELKAAAGQAHRPALKAACLFDVDMLA